MFIDEIPVNSKISINFVYVTKSINLETTIKKPGSHNKDSRSTIANVIRVDGKIVNLNNFRGTVTVKFVKQGSRRCDIWEHVKIKYDKINKEYTIITPKASKKQERRGAPRIPLGVGATVQIEGDARRHNCSIHDISVTGVGLRMEALDFSVIGKKFTIEFSDKTELISFTFNGRCVREVNDDSKIKIYGCTIKASPELSAYIKKRQIRYENTLKASGRS